MLERGLQTNADDPSRRFFESHGTFELPSGHRIAQLAVHASYMAAASGDRAVHVYRIRTLEEAQKKQQRRVKRAREKGDDSVDAAMPMTWLTRLEPYVVVRPTIGRIRSFAFPSGHTQLMPDVAVPILCALTTNSAEIHSIPPPPRTKAEKLSLIHI